MEHNVNPKNRDVRRLSAYHDHGEASPQSFDSLLKEIEERRSRPSRKWYILGAGAFLLLGGVFFFVWQSASLRVVLTPKKITIKPEGQMVVLPFEKISLRVPLEGADIPFTLKKVEERARGIIVVYNAYSAKPHRFVARTRFESPDGRIYRIEKSLLIPGTKEEGGTLVPGSIEAEIVAENPGEEYNKELADFTVPGLKGSALFEKFYARSKGSLAGGRGGEERVFDREALASSEEFAQKERAIIDTLRAQMPDGFLLPEAGWKISYTGDPPDVEAEIIGLMIKREDLGAKLASLFFEAGEAERVALVDDARLSLTNVSPLDDSAKDAAIRVMAQGEVVYAERVAKEEMPAALAKLRSSEEVDTFLKEVGSVESATLIFSPAFLKRIPSNPNRITIDVTR